MSCASGELATPPGPLVVGEEIAANLRSPAHAPAAGSREAELVWQQEISHPEGTYIALHFSQFNLPDGAELSIRTPDHVRRVTYTGKGKDIPGSAGFWAMHMPGDRAILELTSSRPLPEGAVVLDRFARGLPAWTQLGNEIASLGAGTNEDEAICGADDSQNAKCVQTTEPAAYNEARAVARLLMNGSGACTGWLVGSGGHVMTNEHCIGDQATASNTNFEFMAEGADCTTNCSSWGACPGTVVAQTSTVVKINASLDYALVQLPTNPTETYGYLQLRQSGPVAGERIYIPQHPAAWGKRIALKDGTANATISTVSAPACTSGAPVPDVGYMADTQGGSSGSPVLGYTDNLVVALHHCANCPNRGVPINAIINDLSATNNLPPDAVVGGGGGDTTPPVVTLTAPASGATVSGTVAVTATATDDTGVSSVEFLVDGTSIGTDTTAPYAASWTTTSATNGPHQVTARARDAAGNSASSDVMVTVQNGGGGGNQAVYDAALRAPACRSETNSCDTGTLVNGRAAISGGVETNASNTIDNCADGTTGTYHSDESNDRVVVRTVSGNNFAAGETVRVDATVWAWSSGSSDRLDVFYATNALSPTWTLINTITPTAGGLQTLSTTFTLPSGGAELQAVRVQWRYNGTAVACTSGGYNDRDDLVIRVAGGGGGGGNGQASYDATLRAPLCTGAAASCTSLDLLNGRGTISGGNEPHTPNTIGGTCADGNSGTYHRDESVDRIVVTSSSGNLGANRPLSIAITAYFYSATADYIDVYYAPNAASPVWQPIATNLRPTAGGLQTLTVNHTPTSSGRAAIRAQIRWNGSASSCTAGGYNDHDDLVFDVE